MTGQMADIVVIDDEEWALVEPGPDVLFDPREHGLSPVMSHTANLRGTLARYRIDEGQLLLSDLQVGHVEQPPPINGIESTTDEYAQVWTYLDLDIPIEWTGDLLAGADPILELYVPSGFPQVWHYERVVAIDLDDGVMAGQEDRSAEVADFRAHQDDDEDENALERFLAAIRLRLPSFGDEEE